MKENNHGDVSNNGKKKEDDLASVDRSKISGFKKYFSMRPFHFQDLFRMEYSAGNAEIAFRTSNRIGDPS